MATFDNTRPLVAAMAVGCASAALDLTRELLAEAGVEVDYDRPALTQSAAAAKFLQMEADLEGARLLMLQAAWMADNRKPNSLEASMAKAKAGRVGSDITLSLRRAVRRGRLQRDRAAREVGPRLQDPRHLRGHPADPAADRRPPGARAVERRAQVASGGEPLHVLRPLEVGDRRGTRCRRRARPVRPSGRAARPAVPACVRSAYAAAAVRPRSRSTRAQASSRSVPIVGRSRTVTRTVSECRRSVATCSSSGGRAEDVGRVTERGRDPQGPVPGAADDDRDVARRAAGSRSSPAG